MRFFRRLRLLALNTVEAELAPSAEPRLRVPGPLTLYPVVSSEPGTDPFTVPLLAVPPSPSASATAATPAGLSHDDRADSDSDSDDFGLGPARKPQMKRSSASSATIKRVRRRISRHFSADSLTLFKRKDRPVSECVTTRESSPRKEKQCEAQDTANAARKWRAELRGLNRARMKRELLEDINNSPPHSSSDTDSRSSLEDPFLTPTPSTTPLSRGPCDTVDYFSLPATLPPTFPAADSPEIRRVSAPARFTTTTTARLTLAHNRPSSSRSNTTSSTLTPIPSWASDPPSPRQQGIPSMSPVLPPLSLGTMALPLSTPPQTPTCMKEFGGGRVEVKRVWGRPEVCASFATPSPERVLLCEVGYEAEDREM
ncbi:hypothetical protein VTI74DRAFT_11657 [Chaetomium olivicolor]